MTTPNLSSTKTSSSTSANSQSGTPEQLGQANYNSSCPYEKDARIYEYVKACDPAISPVPVLVHPPALHESGATRVIPFDLSKELKVNYEATSPNLMASYIRINSGDSISVNATATSQSFYIMRGNGKCVVAAHQADIVFGEGDLFVIPGYQSGNTSGENAAKTVEEINKNIVISCSQDCESVAIYWVHDGPLLSYLGVTPCEKKFEPTLFKRDRMLASVELLIHDENAKHKNRLGILLGNKITEENTLTLTHTLWSLLNLLPAHNVQRPHRHNSVALDLAVKAPPQGAYTLMGPELDEDGWVKNPIRVEWATNGVFVTPPGWWHSHHNDSGEDAWVLPLQDAGLHTHMRTLDIQFAPPLSDNTSKLCMKSVTSTTQFPHLVDQYEAKTDPSNQSTLPNVITGCNGNGKGL